MANRITNVLTFHSVQDPTLARITVSVHTETLTSTSEVRGAFTGPRCPFATTVEVAYPLREGSRYYEMEDHPHIIAHAKIPEPSWWEPETPFVYHGTIELWQHGVFCDRVHIAHRLRDLKLNAAGLRLNGRPYMLRGVWRKELTPADLPALRSAGFNTILTQPGPDCAALWNEADRLGFFMIAWLPDRASVRDANPVDHHPATLACIIPARVDEPEVMELYGPTILPSDGHAGFEVIDAAPVPSPNRSHFLFCSPSRLSSLTSVRVPKLLRITEQSASVATSQALLTEPGIMGWVLERAV